MNRLPYILLMVFCIAGTTIAATPGDGEEVLTEAERHNNLGTQHAARGDFRQAAGSFRKAVSLDPRMTVAHYNLGLALARVENHEDAAYAFRSAVRLAPRYFDAWFQLGLSLLVTEDFDDAAEAFSECLTLRRDDPAALFRLGQANWRAGKWEAVIATWDRLLNTTPSHPSVRIVIKEMPAAYYNVGHHLQAAGRIPEAQEAYEDALRLDGRYVPALNNLGILLDAKGEHDKAVNFFKRALEAEPEHLGARLGVAGALKSAGRFDEALRHYDLLRDRVPDDARVYKGLALTYAARGDRKGAERWLAEAAPRMDEYARALLKAFVLEHGTTGERYGPGYDEAGALATYQDMAERFPDRPQPHYNLGVIHARGSRWTEATEAFDRALAIDSTYTAAREALDEVDRINADTQFIFEFKTR